ncbi:MAG TPA: hypothetical protein VF585_06550 [Chthoniobacterales bacterium]|jgi:membrane associated rhomboid family serine protease
MSLLNKLERAAAPIAIPGIIRYVAFLSSAAFIIGLAMPETREMMALEPHKVLQGELWRFLTFAFIPSTYSLFWIFALMLLFFIGTSLEQAMGATRLTLFYLMGWLATVVATFAFGAVGTPIYLSLSLLLAFATLFPDEQILLLFIPVKVKWIAIFSLVANIAVAGSLANYGMLGLCLANYLLFFGVDMVKAFQNRQEIAQRQHEFREKARPEEETLHCCHICKRTEATDPDLDFRVSADGEEYCVEHLPSRAV